MEKEQVQLSNSACQTYPRFETKVVSYQNHQKQSQNYSPFLSTTQRHDIVNPTAKNMPAPGSYNLQSIFNVQDIRDKVYEQCHLQLYNTRKINENVVFKSTKNRFDYMKKNQLNVTAVDTYHSRSDFEQSIRHRSTKFHNKKIHNTFSKNSLPKNPRYPSIPDKTAKYGYNISENNLKKISKSQKQLQKQKLAMKAYAKKLKQNSFQTNNSTKMFKNSRMSLNLLKQSRLINSKLCANVKKNTSKDRSISACKQTKPKHNIVKYPTVKCNAKKIMKIAQQKLKCQINLGPGSYDINDITKMEKIKDQKYQFFNSTEERFSLNDASYINDVSHKNRNIFKSQNLSHLSPTYFGQKNIVAARKALKRPTHQKSTQQNNQNYAPGPGDYYPQQIVVKKTSKGGVLNRAKRFQNLDNQEKINSSYQNCNLKPELSINTPFSEEKNRLKLRNQFEIKPNKAVNFGENLKNLKGKKQMIEQKLKQYFRGAKNTSQYSVSAWQNKPQSRSDVMFSQASRIAKKK